MKKLLIFISILWCGYSYSAEFENALACSQSEDYKCAYEIFKILVDEDKDPITTAQSAMNIGEMYQYGWGVDKDSQMAMKYYNIAATKKEFPTAQFKLGLIYLDGIDGVREDEVLARKWLKESCDAKHKSACSFLERMNKNANKPNRFELHNLSYGIEVGIFQDWQIQSADSIERELNAAKKVLKNSDSNSKIQQFSFDSLETIFSAQKAYKNGHATITVVVTPPDISQEQLEGTSQDDLENMEVIFREAYKDGVSARGGSDFSLSLERIKVNDIFGLHINTKYTLPDKLNFTIDKYQFYLANKCVALNIEKRFLREKFEIDEVSKIINSIKIY